MAKKTTSAGTTTKKTTHAPAAATHAKKAPGAGKASQASTPPKSTEIRNTPVPKPAAVKPAAAPAGGRPIPTDMVAKRAYEIWASGKGGTEEQNWLQAERELRTGK